MQRILLHPVTDGVFTDQFAARLRGWQMTHGVLPTGEIDETTYEMLMGNR